MHTVCIKHIYGIYKHALYIYQTYICYIYIHATYMTYMCATHTHTHTSDTSPEAMDYESSLSPSVYGIRFDMIEASLWVMAD